RTVARVLRPGTVDAGWREPTLFPSRSPADRGEDASGRDEHVPRCGPCASAEPPGCLCRSGDELRPRSHGGREDSMKMRSAWAVVAGVLFIIVVTTLVDIVLHVTHVYPP